jgi:integrative and conjugative element protein (TIGR02256 family)
MWSPLILPHPSVADAWILIEEEALEIVGRYRQSSPGASEGGGVLLGYRRGNHLHVTQATVPSERDERSRFSFDRFDRRHGWFVMRRWKGSNQRCDYLGEWHTHPESHPSPSGTDEREWRKLHTSNPRPLLFWIEGTADRWLGLGFEKKISRLGSA